VSINSYTELKTAIADWINRDDLTDARLSDFVSFAENRIFHELRIPTMERVVVLDTDSEGKAYIPADFLEAKDVFYNGAPLDRISLTDLTARGVAEGKPMTFAREGGYLTFWPTPGDITGTDNELRMIYYAEPDRLSEENADNSVFLLAPDLYLYGALVAAGVYLASPMEKINTWQASFDDLLSRLTTHARQAEVSGSTMMVKSGY
jgi:hypothetical protein